MVLLWWCWGGLPGRLNEVVSFMITILLVIRVTMCMVRAQVLPVLVVMLVARGPRLSGTTVLFEELMILLMTRACRRLSRPGRPLVSDAISVVLSDMNSMAFRIVEFTAELIR